MVVYTLSIHFIIYYIFAHINYYTYFLCIFSHIKRESSKIALQIMVIHHLIQQYCLQWIGHIYVIHIFHYNIFQMLLCNFQTSLSWVYIGVSSLMEWWHLLDCVEMIYQNIYDVLSDFTCIYIWSIWLVVTCIVIIDHTKSKWIRKIFWFEIYAKICYVCSGN